MAAMKPRDSDLTAASRWLFHQLVWIYPWAYRHSFGGLMEQLFFDQTRAALRHGGRWALARLWLRTLLDLGQSALREYGDAMQKIKIERRTWIVLATAALMAFFLGWVDLTASEVQAPLGVALMCSFALGIAQPRRAWRWALILSVGVSLAELLAVLVGFEPAGMIHSQAVHPAVHLTFGMSNVYESLFLLIPTTLAAYGGALMRKISGK
jgi:hypothetical protein